MLSFIMGSLYLYSLCATKTYLSKMEKIQMIYKFCLYLKLREVEKSLNKENIWSTYNSVRSGLSQFQIKLEKTTIR